MRRIDFSGAPAGQQTELLQRQWLITNGLGGYASATLSGAVTWRYHGLLIAALPAPLGRTVMLNHLGESLRFPDGHVVQFGGGEWRPAGEGSVPNHLIEFRLDHHLPVWRYRVGGVVIEKRVLMPNRQNTVHVTYTVEPPRENCWLELRPSLHFRPLEENVGKPLASPYELRARGLQFEFDARDGIHPPLRMTIEGPGTRYVHEGASEREIFYQMDADRGLDARGPLWTSGYFSIPVRSQPVTLIASTEPWHIILALDAEGAAVTERARSERLVCSAPAPAREGAAAELVLAADQFLIHPAGRVRDAARARAAGDELRSVIAGYHWFTDWGRDTMISFEGLTLTTGRHQEAAWILRTFAHYVRDGLLPNMFPEGKNEGLYHTADATLWFFHAVHRYLEVTGDRVTLVSLLPTLRAIIEHHLRGTRFGIGVDSADGLLRQGADGYQLTWMDAKVGDWVVTPRRGKAVEINALWYNALRLMADWLLQAEDGAAAVALRRHADRTRDSFNRRFWNEGTGCLFDVIDGENGDDAAIRPNQIFAVSLPHPVLDQARWESVLRTVHRDLLTPRGLRSLSPTHPDYKPRYTGDLRARDAAYHQGTVWGWLIGPFIDAWLKVHPRGRADARKFVAAMLPHLDEAGIGSISEIFDADAPYSARGCIAQAWSVAEVLRTLVLTAEEKG